MATRRSVLLFVCCYMLLFCIYQNLQENFQGQEVQQRLLEETDSKRSYNKNYEIVQPLRHLNAAFDSHINDDIIKERLSLTPSQPDCQKPASGTDSSDKFKSEAQLRNLLNNCNAFLKDHGYLDFPVTKEEKEFPLAFGIKIHKNLGQVEQLLRTIYRPHNVYCIHVDQKADNETFDIMKRIGDCLSNIVIIEERETVVYASAALVRAEIKCMATVMKSGIKWKYYINMAGQEFPLRTNLEMVKVLQEMNGANDIETYNHPVFLDWRIQSSYSVTGNSLAEDGKKSDFKYTINISKGSAYGLFTRNFVDFILNDRVAQNIIQYFNDTFAPEENVWATINTLPWAPGGYPMEVRHLFGTFMSRAVIWAGDSPKCHGNFVRGVCIFKSPDFQWLVKRPEFFANKFDESLDKNILNCLERWYRNRALREIVLLDRNYYLKLPHVEQYRTLSNFRKSKGYLTTLKRKWMKENKVKNKLT